MDEMTWRPNFAENDILAALPIEEMRRLRPELTPVRFVMGQVLYEPGEQMSSIFFLGHGIASVVALADGIIECVEVGLCGRESILGCMSSLGADAVSFNRILMQTNGAGYRMSADTFRASLPHLPQLKASVSLNIELLFAQISQLAACNSQHSLTERLARWLLQARDRSDGDELAFTHGVLATMISVRRAGVTVALRLLGNSGVIEYGRGKILIKDRIGLEHAACTCYARLRNFGAARSLGRIAT